MQGALNAPERWHVNEVPGPLPWVDEADLQAQGLRDSEFSRLHLNIWTQSEDRLVSAVDLLAAAVLDGEQEPLTGVQYVMSVDIGLVNDRTVVCVGHSEPISSEPGAQRRVVLDSIKRWQGRRGKAVQIGDIEAYLALTARRYNNAKILADPWQAAGMIQRLKSQGVRAEEFPFTTTSTGRIGQALHLSLKNHLLWLPDDDDLLTELGRVRLKETSIGQARLDHDSGGHDDQAVAIGMLVAELIGKNQSTWEWFDTLHPTHDCGQRNPREATVCSKCHEPLTPPAPDPVSAPVVVEAQPWSPWSPIRDNIPRDRATESVLELLAQHKQHDYWASRWQNSSR